MKNILLIIRREYLTRVKKKSFILLTLLVPFLIIAMYAGIAWAAFNGSGQKNIDIIDKSGLFVDNISAGDTYILEFINDELETAKAAFPESGKEALVYIPADIMENLDGLKIFAENGIPLELQNRVERAIEREIESIKLREAGISREILESAKMNVGSETIRIQDGKEERSSSGAASAIGFICAFLIYISIFIYGVQVMRGVMEEKTSRIIEIIISSVKPFQLMIGKIVGVAFVGLTQFTLWIVLIFTLLTVGGKIVGNMMSDAPSSQVQNLSMEAGDMLQAEMPAAKNNVSSELIDEVLNAASTLPIATIVICFLFYFLGGYFIYSALFGAVGSAVDGETDTQQFILPITLPIIASFIMAQFVINDPNGPIAFWGSMIPLTSPIIMMVRIPFGVPLWQIVLSISLLIAGFVFTTWVAARIYRIGILMYGKKASWKEISKWIFYKG